MSAQQLDIVRVLEAWFSTCEPKPDVWRPQVDGYFDLDSERAVPAPSLCIDDWNLLFVLFVVTESTSTAARAAEALRDVTTHLNLLYRSLRDLDMNRLMVGLVYPETDKALSELRTALAELPTADRAHRLVLLPRLTGTPDTEVIREVLRPLMPVSIPPFLRPIEPDEVWRAIRAVSSEKAQQDPVYADLLQDIEAFIPQQTWGEAGPWPQMRRRITQIGPGSAGGEDV